MPTAMSRFADDIRALYAEAASFLDCFSTAEGTDAERARYGRLATSAASAAYAQADRRMRHAIRYLSAKNVTDFAAGLVVYGPLGTDQSHALLHHLARLAKVEIFVLGWNSLDPNATEIDLSQALIVGDEDAIARFASLITGFLPSATVTTKVDVGNGIEPVTWGGIEPVTWGVR